MLFITAFIFSIKIKLTQKERDIYAIPKLDRLCQIFFFINMIEFGV